MYLCLYIQFINTFLLQQSCFVCPNTTTQLLNIAPHTPGYQVQLLSICANECLWIVCFKRACMCEREVQKVYVGSKAHFLKSVWLRLVSLDLRRTRCRCITDVFPNVVKILRLISQDIRRNYCCHVVRLLSWDIRRNLQLTCTTNTVTSTPSSLSFLISTPSFSSLLLPYYFRPQIIVNSALVWPDPIKISV